MLIIGSWGQSPFQKFLTLRVHLYCMVHVHDKSDRAVPIYRSLDHFSLVGQLNDNDIHY